MILRNRTLPLTGTSTSFLKTEMLATDPFIVAGVTFDLRFETFGWLFPRGATMKA